MKSWTHHKKLLKFSKKLVPTTFIIILFLFLSPLCVPFTLNCEHSGSCLSSSSLLTHF